MPEKMMNQEENVLGEWRKAVNAAAGMVHSIHDDAVGKKVGMRGGVVAGTMHLDLFPPVLLKQFGQRSFEQGAISLFFTYALLDGEELRVVMQPPDGKKDALVETQLQSRDGHLVARGTLSVGNPKEPSYLRSLELKNSPREEMRILREIEVGWQSPFKDVLATDDDLAERVKNSEDTVEWNSGGSPWGPAILPPSQVARLMQITLPFKTEGVGFYGANELRYVNGPVKVNTPYKVQNKVIAAGVTSKTEYFWFEARMYEQDNDNLIAEMRHMTRFMKAGSPLYPEVSEGN